MARYSVETNKLQDHLDAINGRLYKEIIKDALHYLRSKIKHSDITDEQVDVLVDAKDFIFASLNDEGVNIYE